MNGGINGDEILDSVEFRLFPSENRYEASVQIRNTSENVASGPLEQLLFHSPEIRELSYKGFNTEFKILRPVSVNDADWFTSTTLTRFLHIVGLQDILSMGKEISQLEETKKFQLSLSEKAEVDLTTSIEAKNELLVAVDLRLTSLKEELAAAFKQVNSSKYSIKDISDLGNFALHFGAKDLRDSLQKSVELATEDNDSTYSIEEDQPSVERSRDISRSERPRRSASPMRRIQIGRSSSRRAAALSVKSLGNFQGREKSTSQRDAAGNSSEEEDTQKPLKKNVLRMSVQDKISLFESKQKDRVEDIPKTKTSPNVTISASKAVLRRWSSGMASTELSSPNGKPEPDSNISNTETCAKISDNISLVPEADTVERERDESREKVAELNEVMPMMERKTGRHRNVTNDNSKQKNLKEQKKGFYDLYKKKRDEKLQGEASGKKLEMASIGVSGVYRRPNEPQKTQKNSTRLIDSRTAKPPCVKKSSPKTSPLPSARKSWPSTPSPKATKVSPARTSTGPTSTTSTPTNRKSNSSASVVRSSSKVEDSQLQLKTLKATQTAANKRIKPINEKKQPTVTENRKMTKTHVQTSKPDSNSPTKPSFYNKVTKKHSVVPLETKSFLRKGSGIKAKNPAQKTEENKPVTEIDITNQNQENECKKPENVANLDLEPQVVSLSPTKCDESESNSEDGLEISSAAWVVMEENDQDEIIPCKETSIKLSSPANETLPAGYSRPRIRHTLSQMFFEDSNDADIGESGNAEHPSTLIYQKYASRGLKRLLKFTRKPKPESAFSDGEDDAEESKATRSFFSLSAFRGNKANETKLRR